MSRQDGVRMAFRLENGGNYPMTKLKRISTSKVFVRASILSAVLCDRGHRTTCKIREGKKDKQWQMHLIRVLIKRIICLKAPCGAHTPYGIVLGNFNGIAFLPLRGVFCGFLQAVRSGSWATWNSGTQQSGEGRMVWQK